MFLFFRLFVLKIITIEGSWLENDAFLNHINSVQNLCGLEKNTCIVFLGFRLSKDSFMFCFNESKKPLLKQLTLTKPCYKKQLIDLWIILS